MASKTKKADRLQSDLLRVSRLHFIFVAAVAGQIIVFDSWKLIDPTAVLQRWLIAAVLLCVTTFVWYSAHSTRPAHIYRRLAFGLILADVVVASLAVYNQRGMASRAVLLYIFPLLVAAIIRSRSAIFATAAICIASYVSACVSYFILHFNEGYKVELYGEVSFYCVIFLIVAGLLHSLVASRE